MHWTPPPRSIACCLAVGLIGLLLAGEPPAGRCPGAFALQARTRQQSATLLVPPVLPDTTWLDALRDGQVATAGAFDVIHDFRFTDVVAESGIAFQHRIVSDAGRTYRAVHYDHGNGAAAADVDGDGRPDLYFSSQVGANGLWRNLGGAVPRHHGTCRVGVADSIGVSASFGDIDNDGDPDLYVTTVRGGNHLFENDGQRPVPRHLPRGGCRPCRRMQP